MPRAFEFPKRVGQQVMEDEVPDLAAGLAYRFLFAIFPFAIFLAALAGFLAQFLGLGDPTDQIIGALDDNLPAEIAGQVGEQLRTVLGEARPGLLSVGGLAALWAATGGISALINSMNKAYDVEETRGFVGKTLRALLLTTVGSAGILVAFITIVGGSFLSQQAIETLGLGETGATIISLLRFPVVIGLVTLAVALLFRFGPNVTVSFRWTLIGGLVFAVGWLVATVLFGLYVANFANYANTYGALGGVIVLMLWFYLTAILLLVAAEVTAVLAKEREPEVVEARRTEIREAASAPRKVGQVVGAVAGVAKAATGDDESADPAVDQSERAGRPDGADGRDSERPRERRPEPAPAPITRIPRQARGASASDGPGSDVPFPSRVSALLFVAGAAVVGAIAGMLSGDDEDGATG